jgi:aspartate kinase
VSDQLTVMKFGGTSVEDDQAFQRVAHIVDSNESSNLVVIVSAMSGVTNALICGFERAAKGETSEALLDLEHHFERHIKVSSALSSTARDKMMVAIEQSRNEIIEICADVSASRTTTAQRQDAIASHGERLSASLLTIVLEEHGIPASYVDARLCIITNGQHGCARPLLEQTYRQTRAELQPLLNAKTVPVLGGFVGASKNCMTTTLGRGSSDYSATLISAALGACETQIWTDVDGVMTADPDLVMSASTVSQLSYEEAAELAQLGAKVLHSRMIEPVVEQKIPIRILNSRAPERSGTLICASTEKMPQAVKAIASKTNLTRIDITSTPGLVANGFLSAIRKIFDRHRTQMDIVAMSEVGISIACAEAGALPSLVQDLKQVGSVETKSQQAMISCVGKDLQSVDNTGKLLNILKEIDPTLIWHAKSRLSLISMVDVDFVGPVVRKVHQGLFERGH